MNKESKIFVAGHRGLVGSALCRVLRNEGYKNLITVTRGDVDLTDPVAVRWFFSSYQPEFVFLAAAKVGGIVGNANAPVEFMLENLRIQDNVISCSHKFGVKKLLFLGSACAYPKHAANPITEDALLTGPLEPSNECYALAKICGIKLCRAYRKQYDCDFISAMPTNLYGIGDHYDLQGSHVIPGMIRRMHEAKGSPSVTLWGTGRPIREFLYADDLARACLVLMNQFSGTQNVNISSGIPIVLRQLAEYVATAVGFDGGIVWDTDKPDGTPVRRQDTTILDGYGWQPEVSIQEGLKLAYQDFLCQVH